jgi:hypothetical protein
MTAANEIMPRSIRLAKLILAGSILVNGIGRFYRFDRFGRGDSHDSFGSPVSIRKINRGTDCHPYKKPNPCNDRQREH